MIPNIVRVVQSDYSFPPLLPQPQTKWLVCAAEAGSSDVLAVSNEMQRENRMPFYSLYSLELVKPQCTTQNSSGTGSSRQHFRNVDLSPDISHKILTIHFQTVRHSDTTNLHWQQTPTGHTWAPTHTHTATCNKSKYDRFCCIRRVLCCVCVCVCACVRAWVCVCVHA